MEGATLLRDLAKEYPETEWIFEYSPESFNQTEVDFSIKICDAVCQVWRPDLGQQVIFNLPSTVESSTPNLYADQVEYFCRHLLMRKDVLVSLHTHKPILGVVIKMWCGLIASQVKAVWRIFYSGILALVCLDLPKLILVE